MMKTKQHEDASVFLRMSKCSVHDAKPRACGLYPLGFGPDDETPGEWLQFMIPEKRHHFSGQRRLVQDWINETISEEDRDFVALGYIYTAELAWPLKRIDRKHEEQILRLMLLFQYAFFDTSEDFLPQYIRNMENLKAQVKRLL